MFKRVALTLTFLAAFGAVGIGLSNEAQAWRGYYGRPYRAYYAGPRAVYYGGPPVVAPYGAYYGPRVVRPYYAAYPAYYGPPAYPVYYGGYYPAPGGVSVSVGF